MAHYKRKGPKDTRAGCLMCKPHKSNGAKGSFGSQTMQERKAIVATQLPRTWSKGGKRKPYTIEACSGSGDYLPKESHWMLFRRYAMERDRDQALAVLQRKMSRRAFLRRRRGLGFVEFYRVGPTDR